MYWWIVRIRPGTFIKTVNVSDFYIKLLLIKIFVYSTHTYSTLFQFVAWEKKKKCKALNINFLNIKLIYMYIHKQILIFKTTTLCDFE